jgi:hypothetical protein
MSNSAEPQPAVWTRHALARDQAAFEDMIASLPPEIADSARELIEQPGGRKMRFNEARKCVYVIWNRRADGIFSCTIFQNIASLEQATELWDEIENLSTPDTAIMRGLYAKVTGLGLD